MKYCVSCPGKVLLAGGYLVLDQKYSGLVLATSARFYTSIEEEEEGLASTAKITVSSHQFTDGYWEYEIIVSNSQIILSPSGTHANSYVHKTLAYTLNIILNLRPDLLKTISSSVYHITIKASNDFYSQRVQGRPLTTSQLRAVAKFNTTGKSISAVHKTGLGSSAALITSLVAVMLCGFGVTDLKSNAEKSKKLIHNISQFCHCLVQGKIGSGFDVNSAVYGSSLYTRFSPSILDPFLTSALSSTSKFDYAGLSRIVNLESGLWDNAAVPFSLPPRMTLKLADLDAGSCTPKLVSKVIAWKIGNPLEANALWDSLHTLNKALEVSLRLLTLLSTLNPAEYDDEIRKLSYLPAAAWNSSSQCTAEMCKVYSTFQSIRSLLQKLGKMAGVPIEPEQQTRLLDACMKVPGILMAGVPGAGGFDAIFCVGLGDDAIEKCECMWSKWTEVSVGPLLCSQDLDQGVMSCI